MSGQRDDIVDGIAALAHRLRAELGDAAVLTDRAGLAAVLEHGDAAPDVVPVLVVDDARAVLGPVSAAVYGDPSTKLSVVGVTGTSGKTTTGYLLEAGPVIALVAITLAAMGIYSAIAPFLELPASVLAGAAAASGIALVNSLGNLGGFAAPYAPTYFNMRKTTIYGGSNEVQRNIVAQTVLGS